MCVGSLNVRGLGDKVKRRAMFDHFRKMKLDVILVQEAHIKDEEQRKLWEVEWGGKLLASYGSSNARGVMILIKPGLKGTINLLSDDTDGRMLLLELNIESKK